MFAEVKFSLWNIGDKKNVCVAALRFGMGYVFIQFHVIS